MQYNRIIIWWSWIHSKLARGSVGWARVIQLPFWPVWGNYTEPSIGAFFQISINLAKLFLEKIFFNWPITNKNCIWMPCMIGMIMEILYTISHTSYLQSNNSLCLLVSDETICFNFSQPETVSDCCLAPTPQSITYIMARTS